MSRGSFRSGENDQQIFDKIDIELPKLTKQYYNINEKSSNDILIHWPYPINNNIPTYHSTTVKYIQVETDRKIFAQLCI